MGGLLVVMLGIIDEEEAAAAIDLKARGLSKPALFEFVAGLAIRLSPGQPFRMRAKVRIGCGSDRRRPTCRGPNPGCRIWMTMAYLS